MAQACLDAKLEGFPTWEINGQVYSQSEMPVTSSQIIIVFKLGLFPQMSPLPAYLPLIS